MSQHYDDRPQQRGEPQQRNEGRESAKQPSYIAYQVREGQDNKAHFNRVGAAFAHKDGQGHDVLLDAMPVNGRVTLRTPQERVQDARNNGKRSSNRDSHREPGLDYDR